MAEAPSINQLECRICGYKWYPRTPHLPKVCPNCKHRNWNEEVSNVKKGQQLKRLNKPNK